MDEAGVTVSIPKDRIGVLIGPKGDTKYKIERALNVVIEVDSESGLIFINKKSEGSDPLALLRAKDVVMAIGRGFSPEKAFSLLDEDAVLEVLDLRDALGKDEKTIARVKSRVIGQEGKTRRIIEESTGASVCVYGHTIALIGDFEGTSIAREAIEMLIRGRQHSTVYKFLWAKRRNLKKKKVLELWKKTIQ
ncbi:MAG: KH domain-containing protein [Candidatus Bathyarchaeia archaeon]